MDETFEKMSDPKNKKELKDEEYKLRKRFRIQALVVFVLLAIAPFLEYLSWFKFSSIITIIPAIFSATILVKSFIEIRKLMLKYHQKKYQ